MNICEGVIETPYAKENNSEGHNKEYTGMPVETVSPPVLQRNPLDYKKGL